MLIKRLEGERNYRDETVAQQNFLPLGELKKKGWTVLKQALEETQITLIRYLRNNTDSFLLKEYQSGYTLDYHIEGIVQHDIYHLGQIGLVKKILELTSPDV